MLAKAEAAGIAHRTLERAKKNLNIQSRQRHGDWWWEALLSWSEPRPKF
jgi:hypothetical protein